MCNQCDKHLCSKWVSKPTRCGLRWDPLRCGLSHPGTLRFLKLISPSKLHQRGAHQRIKKVDKLPNLNSTLLRGPLVERRREVEEREPGNEVGLKYPPSKISTRQKVKTKIYPQVGIIHHWLSNRCINLLFVNVYKNPKLYTSIFCRLNLPTTDILKDQLTLFCSFKLTRSGSFVPFSPTWAYRTRSRCSSEFERNWKSLRWAEVKFVRLVRLRSMVSKAEDYCIPRGLRVLLQILSEIPLMHDGYRKRFQTFST